MPTTFPLEGARSRPSNTLACGGRGAQAMGNQLPAGVLKHGVVA